MLERAQSYQLSVPPVSSLNSSRSPSPTNEKNTTIAFAFDIDGVCIRSKTPIPGANEALALLQQLKIPFIFLTNGGGKTEKDHVALLAERLHLELSEDQFLQAHTPFKDLVTQLKDKNILVLGGTRDSMRNVAETYGFQHVYTSSDIYKSFPDIYPFDELTSDYHEETGRQVKLNSEGRFQISAILIWSSPRTWGLDLQIMMDLLLSEKGYVNTISSKNGDKSLPNSGYGEDSQPAVYWCNPDITWATAYPLPRIAQGSFRAALQGIWLAQTGLRHIPNETTIGKPTRATFLYGEKTLVAHNRKLHGDNAHQIEIVYMVGDNPSSDIQGANAFHSPRGIEWRSILVETGLYVAGTKPIHEPTYIAKDILGAVKLAVAEIGAETSRSNLSKSSTLVDLTELSIMEEDENVEMRKQD